MLGGGAGALAAVQRTGGGTQGDTGGGDGSDAAGDVGIGDRERVVETARIPEVGFRTAQAAVARLDRPAGALVPARGGAGSYNFV